MKMLKLLKRFFWKIESEIAVLLPDGRICPEFLEEMDREIQSVAAKAHLLSGRLADLNLWKGRERAFLIWSEELRGYTDKILSSSVSMRSQVRFIDKLSNGERADAYQVYVSTEEGIIKKVMTKAEFLEA